MHPTEKTLKIYKEDNEKLRAENSQLSQRLAVQANHISAYRAEEIRLLKQLEQLSELYRKETLRNKKPTPTRATVHLTPERVALFTDVETFIRSYDGHRPEFHEVSDNRTLNQNARYLSEKGSYIPAPLLRGEFLSLPQHRHYDPNTLTLNVFNKQLNQLGLQRIRVRQAKSVCAKLTNKPRAPSRNQAKVYLYFIPYDYTSALSTITPTATPGTHTTLTNPPSEKPLPLAKEPNDLGLAMILASHLRKLDLGIYPGSELLELDERLSDLTPEKLSRLMKNTAMNVPYRYIKADDSYELLEDTDE